MRQIILDTETTGLNPLTGDRVIEIGAIELIDRKLTGQHKHFYLNPDRLVPDAALKIHGITNDFLIDKPRFFEIVEDFMSFVIGAELIIHNAEFDIGFLNNELSMVRRNPYGKITDHCQVLDTLALAKRLYPGQRNSLDALCKRHNIKNSHRTLHGALLDAEILAYVYLAMTGGQEQLFSVDTTSPTKTQAINIEQPLPTHLKVVRANETELIAHQNYFNKQ